MVEPAMHAWEYGPTAVVRSERAVSSCGVGETGRELTLGGLFGVDRLGFHGVDGGANDAGWEGWDPFDRSRFACEGEDELSG